MDEIRKRMRQITRMAQSYTARAMQNSDLSPSQMQALRIVCFHDGISQQELAGHLGIDKAAVARIIAALEDKGYLVRSADPQDGRVKRLAATEAGMALKDALIASETVFFAHIFREIEAADMAVFSQVLELAFLQAKRAKHEGFSALPGDGGERPCS